MSWDRVIGQERAKEALRRAIAQDRVAHAYLFHGPYGTGKRAAAFAFARALLCKVNPGEGCGNCVDCNRIDRMMHPDVRFFMPVPREIDREEIMGRLAELGRNPYESIDFVRRPTAKSANKQAIYPKAFLDEVRPVVSYVAFEGAYKVVVLTGAEALGEETGNVLLKLLEEPSAHSVFILTTERPDQLLPTILSRCQPVRFDPLSTELLEAALVDRDGLSPMEATSAARLADGSYSTARDLLQDELTRSYREQLVPFLRCVYSNDVDGVLQTVEEISKETRDQVKLFLSLMIILVRDLVLVREIGPQAPIANVHELEAVTKLVTRLPHANLEQMVDLVEEASYLVTRNVRPSLILTSLAAGLRACMQGKPALPLVTPLAEQIISDLD